MKQGAGRLIRTETDRGVLMICDPRLTDKPYGKALAQPAADEAHEGDRGCRAFFAADVRCQMSDVSEPTPGRGPDI